MMVFSDKVRTQKAIHGDEHKTRSAGRRTRKKRYFYLEERETTEAEAAFPFDGASDHGALRVLLEEVEIMRTNERRRVTCQWMSWINALWDVSEEATIATQVARGVGNKKLFSRVVPVKGLSVSCDVLQLLKDIDMLGHKKMILKTDGEAALHSSQAEVHKKRSDETLLQNSPV